MNIKNELKRHKAIRNINAYIKSLTQYAGYLKEQKVYEYLGRRSGVRKLSNKEISAALLENLSKKDIYPNPKKIGELHIFLIYNMNNWESILPKSLDFFGKVSEFEFNFQGYDISADNWKYRRAHMNAHMLKEFHRINAKNKIDVVVGYFSGYTVDPHVLLNMSDQGVAIFNFNWDDKLWFKGGKISGQYSGLASIAPFVDLNLTNAPDSCIKYLAEGGLSMFWPEGADADIHKPYDHDFEFDVTFVGGRYGWRPKLIEILRKSGISVTCYGDGWENPSLLEKEMIEIYSKSRINLGFSGVGYSSRLMCLKGRDFEVPMSGGLYLTQNNPELSLVYDVGAEILTYDNAKDCINKIKWVLNNPVIAKKIRENGRVAALERHTWKGRFKDIFQLSNFIN